MPFLLYHNYVGYYTIVHVHVVSDFAIIVLDPGAVTNMQLWYGRIIPHTGLCQWQHILHRYVRMAYTVYTIPNGICSINLQVKASIYRGLTVTLILYNRYAEVSSSYEGQ